MRCVSVGKLAERLLITSGLVLHTVRPSLGLRGWPSECHGRVPVLILPLSMRDL